MHHFRHLNLPGTHPLRRCDPRIKLVTTAFLLIMVITSRNPGFPLLVAALSLGVSASLGVPAGGMLRRLAEPLLIALMVLLLKLFTGGHEPFSITCCGLQVTAYRDGLAEGVRIASRVAGAAGLVAMVGFATPFTEAMAALAWFRTPRTLVEVALFAWRYLFVLLDDAAVVYNAQKNRLGYAGFRRSLRSFGALAGALVIKAFDSSQAITTAMTQRGYDGSMPLLVHKPFRKSEVCGSLLLVALLGLTRLL